MGIKCIEPNPVKRPTTQYIVDMLVEMEHTYGFNETDSCTSSAEHALDVYPLDICFPLETKELIKCPVTLTNRTHDFIGVWITPTCPDACSNLSYPYVWQPMYGKDNPVSSLFARLGPHSSVAIYMTMRKMKQQQPPLEEADEGVFNVVMVATKSEEDLECLGGHWSHDTLKLEKLEDTLGGANKELGTMVHRVTLRVAATSDPARCPEVVVAHQSIQAAPGVEDGYIIDSVDVHPTKTWLLVGSAGPNVSIWNYETQERVMTFEVKVCSSHFFQTIFSIKFIAGEQWFAAGDRNGCIHVYAYPYHAEKDKVKEFEAHRDKTITHLAVHPKNTLLLTAAENDKSIKLWDWSQGWACARVIDTHNAVDDLTVGPRDTSIFATSYDGVKVWDIHSSDAMATFVGSAPIIYTDSHRHFLAAMVHDSHTSSTNARIWDLQTRKHVHTLCPGMLPWELWSLSCHPTLPILAGLMIVPYRNEARHIVLWDARTYRIMKRVELLMEGGFRDMVFNGSEDITSLAVATSKEISVIKINVPMLLTG